MREKIHKKKGFIPLVELELFEIQIQNSESGMRLK